MATQKDKDEACPHCNDFRYFNGINCSSCLYNRNVGTRRITAAERLKMIAYKEERAAEVERIRKELRAHPVTRHWHGARLVTVADICVTLGIKSADEWIHKGPWAGNKPDEVSE